MPDVLHVLASRWRRPTFYSGYLQRESKFFEHFIEGGRTVKEFCQQVLPLPAPRLWAPFPLSAP